jgi:putative ABC transport system permease protein
MMLALMALRNLARNPRRTLLALLVVASGTSALLLTAGFMRHSFHGLEQAFVRGGLGHLELAPAASMDAAGSIDRTAPPSLADWKDVKRDIEARAHVVAASGAIVMSGLVSKGQRTLPFLGAGLEADREKKMGFEPRIRTGRGLSSREPLPGEEEVLVGLGLARQLGAAPGDVVTLTVTTVDGTLNAIDALVVGLVTSGMRELDNGFLRVHLATAQRLLATEAVASVVVMLDEDSSTMPLQAELARRLTGRADGLRASGWRARAPYYEQVRSLYHSIFAFMGTVVAVLVVLASSNTLLMAVTERTRELGALLAIGTSARQVVVMIVLEAAWLGLAGGICGSSLGLGASVALQALAIELPPPPGAVDPVVLGIEPSFWDPLGITAAMVLLLVVASVVPAIRITRLRIAEALVHV